MPRVPRARSFHANFSLAFAAACVPWMLAGGASPCAARAHPRLETKGGTLFVNKRPVLRFKAGSGEQSAEERAQTVLIRLQEQSDKGFAPALIKTRRSGDEYRLVIAGRAELCHIRRADARANHSSASLLARGWAKNLRSALLAPALRLQSRLIVPMGENRVLRIGGWDDSPYATQTQTGADYVGLQSKDAPRRIVVNGTQPGKAIVRVQVGENTAQCVVVVKKWAGKVPTDLRAEVTGRPAAPADLSAQAALMTLRRYRPEPGATLQIVNAPHARRQLRPGQAQTLSAEIVMRGTNYLPVRGTARIRVVNRPLPLRPAARLFYSNTPEHIAELGVLYSATLTDDAPARLMFHHDNARRKPVIFGVSLVNPTDVDLRVHLVPGFVRPFADPALAGYRAGQVFLPNQTKQRGEILLLPAHQTLPLLLQKLARGQTASGLAQIALVEPPKGAKCVVRMFAANPGGTAFARRLERCLDPWRCTVPRPLAAQESGALRPTTQPIYRASRVIEARYVVGQRWMFVPLGMAPDEELKHASGQPVPQPAPRPVVSEGIDNGGDYGVLYTIHATVQNPLPTPQRVTLIFESGAGPVSAVFAIDGQWKRVNALEALAQKSLLRFTLQPNQTRHLTIQTIPLGGSFYPARFIMR